jgi:hypothetical protein
MENLSIEHYSEAVETITIWYAIRCIEHFHKPIDEVLTVFGIPESKKHDIKQKIIQELYR